MVLKPRIDGLQMSEATTIGHPFPFWHSNKVQLSYYRPDKCSIGSFKVSAKKKKHTFQLIFFYRVCLRFLTFSEDEEEMIAVLLPVIITIKIQCFTFSSGSQLDNCVN